jgi:ABC-2 type transport system ATP-binding protein
MISIKNLTVAFSDNFVLKNISIDFEKDKIYGIVGLNGSGKTTFFNALSGVLKFKERQIFIDQHNLTHKEIGYLETVNFFYSGITGREYLNIFRQTNKDFNLEKLQAFLKLPLDKLIESYSTGMKKKLALLGILKQDKLVYIFDEPFNSLDLETNKFLELIIETLRKKGKTIFISSHILEPLIAVCDQILHLENGNFKSSYDRNDFKKIDEELFKRFRKEAGDMLRNAI